MGAGHAQLLAAKAVRGQEVGRINRLGVPEGARSSSPDRECDGDSSGKGGGASGAAPSTSRRGTENSSVTPTAEPGGGKTTAHRPDGNWATSDVPSAQPSGTVTSIVTSSAAASAASAVTSSGTSSALFSVSSADADAQSAASHER